jgi:hypothetical protein
MTISFKSRAQLVNFNTSGSFLYTQSEVDANILTFGYLFGQDLMIYKETFNENIVV